MDVEYELAQLEAEHAEALRAHLDSMGALEQIKRARPVTNPYERGYSVEAIEEWTGERDRAEWACIAARAALERLSLPLERLRRVARSSREMRELEGVIEARERELRTCEAAVLETARRADGFQMQLEQARRELDVQTGRGDVEAVERCQARVTALEAIWDRFKSNLAVSRSRTQETSRQLEGERAALHSMEAGL